VNAKIIEELKPKKMKNLIRLLLVLSVITIYSCYNSTDSKISMVENGLLPGISFSGVEQQGYNILERMHHYNVPAISIAVIDDGKIVWSKAFGNKEVGTDKKISEESIFQMGSVGKMIAAVTILSLVNKDILNLDEDVNEYLKSWKIPGYEIDKEAKITLRQLLSHTAGVSGRDSCPFRHELPLPTLTGYLKSKNVKIIRKPGEEFYYSGTGYVIVEQIIEDVTGKEYKEVAKEEVLKPLGMRNTYFQNILPDTLLKRAAFSHHEDGTLYNEKYPIHPCYAPGTCNWSTAEDLAKLFIELQKSYYGKSNKILPQSLTKVMMTNKSLQYGLGIKLINNNSNTFIGHSGDFYGFHACLFGYLESNKGIVVMTNGDNGVLLYNEIIRSVANNYNWPGCKQEIVSNPVVDKHDLKKLCGFYYLPERLNVLNIYERNNKLYCDVLGETGNELLQISSNKFYDKNTDGFIIFNIDSYGTVENVEYRRIGVYFEGTLLPGFDLLNTDRFEEGIAKIYKAKDEFSQRKYFENIFNSIGYKFLREGKLQHAISVFELAVTIYPLSSNLYDSLGEAYMKSANKEMAIKNYEKSLTLDPDNDNAKEMLKRLRGNKY